MSDLTTPFCPECGHVKHVAGCPEIRAMTDLEALARLATEAGTEIEKLTWPAPDPYYPAFNAFIAAASPDVVLALVRVALAAQEYRARFTSIHRIPIEVDLSEAIDYERDALFDALAALR
jgi:hypothetical protein